MTSIVTTMHYVDTRDSAGALPIVAGGRAARIHVNEGDLPGVLRAAGDLADDMGKVTGVKGELARGATDLGGTPILVGTIGHSAIIDRLIADRKIDVTAIVGQWESFHIEVVERPQPDVDRALVIAGSDRRGTIFGIYDVSEQIGVSPWYWWADVPPRRSEALFVRAGTRRVQGPPKVKYRGIFINDEEPCFGPWAREKFGGQNSKMYAHMFELILRLKGNYLWPAMWGKEFNVEDPLNPVVAHEHGIVMGTSHHEPMLRSWKEWTTHGKGPWNYATNEAELKKFWRHGVERNKDHESIITIGMRGDGDEPMIEGGDMRANMALLERIVADQRQMIAETINSDVTKVPQLWALYKEVLDYYQAGMRVPDDVTLLWCDDNWGNVRRLPTPEERKRRGGAGIYYHFDYVGSPRNYKWINTNPLPKVWEQMNLVYRYGADRIWVVNVGDLKPVELPIDFFLRFAWDPDAMPKERIADYNRSWAEQQFGPEHAAAIADIVTRYARYNGWRKPELLEPTTFSLVNYREAERVLEGWREIVAEAKRIYGAIAPDYRDAFYQLVLYPTKASAVVFELWIETGRNHLYAKQGRASTNVHAQRVRELFRLDQELTDEFHRINGGKWNHMVAQSRIGYTYWQSPPTNNMPALVDVQVPREVSLGVAIEGSEHAWPGAPGQPALPPFDSMNQQRSWIDLFRRGTNAFAFNIAIDQPWIKVSRTSGTIDEDQRLCVSVDWAVAPVGESRGTITITRKGGDTVAVRVSAVRSDQFTRETTNGAIGGLTGPIAFPAERFVRNVEANGVRWERIPNYGREASGMSIFPVTADSVTPPKDSPRLEYKVLIAQSGEVKVDLVTGPTLDFVPGRGLRVAVSFDDERPRVIDAFEGQRYEDPGKRPDLTSPPVKDWARWVSDNARTITSSHSIGQPGVHTLKVWMVDPAVVLEKVVIHRDDLRPSYFGPPETGSVEASEADVR